MTQSVSSLCPEFKSIDITAASSRASETQITVRQFEVDPRSAAVSRHAPRVVPVGVRMAPTPEVCSTIAPRSPGESVMLARPGMLRTSTTALSGLWILITVQAPMSGMHKSSLISLIEGAEAAPASRRGSKTTELSQARQLGLFLATEGASGHIELGNPVWNDNGREDQRSHDMLDVQPVTVATHKN